MEEQPRDTSREIRGERDKWLVHAFCVAESAGALYECSADMPSVYLSCFLHHLWWLSTWKLVSWELSQFSSTPTPPKKSSKIDHSLSSLSYCCYTYQAPVLALAHNMQFIVTTMHLLLEILNIFFKTVIWFQTEVNKSMLLTGRQLFCRLKLQLTFYQL